MTAGKIILYIVAGLMIIFGFLFILGAGGAGGGGAGWVIIGIILWAVAFGAIFLGSRLRTTGGNTQNITYKVDLPANVSMDTLKCKSCGGTLAPENIAMVAGAPVVTCPYCKTTYQLTEQPKW